MVQIHAQLFASFREAVGSRSIQVELGEPATVRALLEAIAARHPAIGPLLEHALVAVNLDYVGPEYRLDRSDEVALIPPVSGGAHSDTKTVSPQKSAAR
jgi:molybdopterin converting factor subunit 1